MAPIAAFNRKQSAVNGGQPEEVALLTAFERKNIGFNKVLPEKERR